MISEIKFNHKPKPGRVRVTGQRLKRARKAAKLTQAQVAELTGYRISQISEHENGFKTNMRIETALTYARVYGVSVELLFITTIERR